MLLVPLKSPLAETGGTSELSFAQMAPFHFGQAFIGVQLLRKQTEVLNKKPSRL